MTEKLRLISIKVRIYSAYINLNIENTIKVDEWTKNMRSDNVLLNCINILDDLKYSVDVSKDLKSIIDINKSYK